MSDTNGHQPPPLTRRLAETIAAIHYDALPDEITAVARHLVLDWTAVALAGSSEPLTAILRAEAADQGGHQQATLVGTGERVSTGQAALINGAASHALDFDDVHLGMTGHPSVPVLPALLALAEHRGATGRDMLAAFVAGVEAECRVAALVMPGHYSHGWHSTATTGAFGAAAACGRLLGLDPATLATAFGIAGTQAAGLKSMFGTMCKPFHAGTAARNGLLAAQLAARGFTSSPAVLETGQGFAATQTATPHPERFLADLGESFAIRDTLFKYHAACYGTHATIEALTLLRERRGVTPERVRAVELRVPEGALTMCNIAEPATALEGKFSLRFTAAMALAGRDTGEAGFTDALTRDPALVALRDRVRVVPDERMSTARTEAIVTLDDGATLAETGDVETPEADLARQWSRLTAKFRALAAPVLGEAQAERLLSAIEHLDRADNVAAVVALMARQPVAVR